MGWRNLMQLFTGGTVPNPTTFQAATTFQVAATFLSSVSALFYSGASQLVAFAAAPNFNPALGEMIHFGVLTGNVTPTVSAGQPGQLFTLFATQDGVGGRTFIWPANVRAAAGWPNAGLNTSSSITFRWDDRLGVPAWIECGRALNI